MGRLAGFKYRDVAQRLRAFGFEPTGKGRGSHEGWANDTTQKQTILPRHTGDVAEGTLRAILRQADIDVDAFLAD